MFALDIFSVFVLKLSCKIRRFLASFQLRSDRTVRSNSLIEIESLRMNTTQLSPSRKVLLVSLGCARNLVDSEVMLGSLFEKGWEKTLDPKTADAVIINTCGFIAAAKEESIDTILEFASLKKTHPQFQLVVTGCLTQRYKRQLAAGLPEVDFFLGTDEFTRVAELLDKSSQTSEDAPKKGEVFAKRTHYLYNEHLPRVNTLSPFTAYVKVAEGCGHNCSFCIIPAIRGRLRSRPISSIVSEVEKLVAKGVIEINLIAQDLAAFGRDKGQDELLPLLKELVKIHDLRWIRLMYVYPENISDEFLEFFASEEKIVKYLDIPMQHASDSVLKRMNRLLTQAELKSVISRVRRLVPNMSIRTTVMVGFPGETEADFQELKSFVQEMGFEHLGCFQYSQEEGTVAARLPDQIPDEVKAERYHQIMEIQQKISSERLKSFIGKTESVLVLGPSKDSPSVWEARLSTQAPEVDGLVFITETSQLLKPGHMGSAHIKDALQYDLIAELV